MSISNPATNIPSFIDTWPLDNLLTMHQDGITCLHDIVINQRNNNPVWSNSEIYLGRDKYFGHKEYLLGDSAFSTSAVMIPAFKKGHNSSLSEEKRFFYTKLAKVRIKSEHCIGLLKAGFSMGYSRQI